MASDRFVTALQECNSAYCVGMTLAELIETCNVLGIDLESASIEDFGDGPELWVRP